MLFEVHHPKENLLPFVPRLSHFQGDDNKRADRVMQDSWFSLKKSHLYLHKEKMDKTGIIEHTVKKKKGLQYTASSVSNRTMMFNVSLKSSFVTRSILLVAKLKQFHVKNVICSYRQQSQNNCRKPHNSDFLPFYKC